MNGYVYVDTYTERISITPENALKAYEDWAKHQLIDNCGEEWKQSTLEETKQKIMDNYIINSALIPYYNDYKMVIVTNSGEVKSHSLRQMKIY